MVRLSAHLLYNLMLRQGQKVKRLESHLKSTTLVVSPSIKLIDGIKVCPHKRVIKLLHVSIINAHHLKATLLYRTSKVIAIYLITYI